MAPTHVGFLQSTELWDDVEGDSLPSSRKGQASDKKNRKQHIRKGCCEIDYLNSKKVIKHIECCPKQGNDMFEREPRNLANRFHSFDQAQASDNPYGQ